MTLKPEELKQAMADPKNKVAAITLTDEMKERLTKACDEMIDELVKRTKGPSEAYMVLHFMMETMEELYGIRGGFTVVNEGEHGHG